MRLIVVIIIQLIVNWIFTKLNGQNVRHVYSIVTGAFLQYLMYREGVLDFMKVIVLSYLAMRLSPRKYVHFSVFAVSFSFLSYLHIKRMIEDYGGWRVDTATQCMVLVLKVTSVGFAYRDGMYQKGYEEELFPHQIQARIMTIPSLMEFFSYCYSCCGCLLGPYFEYKDYINMIERKEHYQNVPNTILASLKTWGQGMFLLVGFAGVGMTLPQNYVFSEEFGNQNMLFKIVYTYLSFSSRRFQFYAAFRLLESTCIASGLGFNGYKNNVAQWDRVIGGFAWICETESDPAIVLKHWNYSIHVWLKNQIFFRSFKKNGGKPTFKTNLTVMLVSALWHGFYPIYYIVFIQLALLVELSKDCGRYQSTINKYIPSPKVRYLLSQLFTKLIYCFILMNHFALLLEKAWQGSRNISFFPIIMLITFFLGFKFVVPRFATPDTQQPKGRKSQIEEDTKKTK
eukprot:403360484